MLTRPFCQKKCFLATNFASRKRFQRECFVVFQWLCFGPTNNLPLLSRKKIWTPAISTGVRASTMTQASTIATEAGPKSKQVLSFETQWLQKLLSLHFCEQSSNRDWDSISKVQSNQQSRCAQNLEQQLSEKLGNIWVMIVERRRFNKISGKGKVCFLDYQPKSNLV